MRDATPPFSRIFLDPELADDAWIKECRSRCSGIPISPSGETLNETAKSLLITKQKGRFLEPCPCTPRHVCCGYYVLDWARNCSLGCSYCILQAYFTPGPLILFGNFADFLPELKQKIIGMGKVRIGTGEYTDSLLIEPWIRLCRWLVPLFADLPNALLEIKTKTDRIAELEGLNHGGRTVVSWSLNPQAWIEKYEETTAPLVRRLAAAKKCQAWGYRVGLHFDPLFYLPGWEKGYRQTVEQVFNYVDPARIAWISLGAFRFMPRLKEIILRNQGRTEFLAGEFMLGSDGKMRYYKPLRLELYTRMAEWLYRYGGRDLGLYLCMETEDVWRQVFGFKQFTSGDLSRMLDERVG